MVGRCASKAVKATTKDVALKALPIRSKTCGAMIAINERRPIHPLAPGALGAQRVDSTSLAFSSKPLGPLVV
eukprot:6611091-Alexandrium_andersonii.AAC.1